MPRQTRVRRRPSHRTGRLALSRMPGRACLPHVRLRTRRARLTARPSADSRRLMRCGARTPSASLSLSWLRSGRVRPWMSLLAVPTRMRCGPPAGYATPCVGHCPAAFCACAIVVSGFPPFSRPVVRPASFLAGSWARCLDSATAPDLTGGAVYGNNSTTQHGQMARGVFIAWH